MSGPQGIITQVSKDDKAAKKKSFWTYFICCGKEDNRTRTPTSVNDRPPAINGEALLPVLQKEYVGKKCLVLDLDETLVHSSFKQIPNADFVLPVEIDDQVHQVYVLKRPGVDHFLKTMAEYYEIVVFTASLSKYADPLLDLLDIHKVVNHRLFRDACSNHKGNYVKDLSRLGRTLKHTIIIDNSPASYLFHPENAIPIDSWFDDTNDTELMDLIPFLIELTKVDDVSTVLDSYHRPGS